MKLSKRLNTIASLINSDDYIADIGCDHAYLPIYLVQNKIISKAVATDIAEGPFEIAKNNIKTFNLQENISLYMCDGLDAVKENVDTIIIAGMGSKTIIDILDKYQRLDKIKKMIIQTNNDYSSLRIFLYNNGFYIKNEIYLNDQNKDYLIFEIYKGNEEVKNEELIAGKFYINNIIWYEKQILKYSNIISCVEDKNSLTYKTNKKILDIYLSYINKKM